jgi:hypothetical protein
LDLHSVSNFQQLFVEVLYFHLEIFF